MGGNGNGNGDGDGDGNVARQGFPNSTSIFPPNLAATHNLYTHQVGSFGCQPQLLALDSMLSASRSADPPPADAVKSFSSNASSSALAGDGRSKFHRRSISEIPLGYGHSSPLAAADIAPSLTLWPPVGFWGSSSSSSAKKSFDFAKQSDGPTKREFEWGRRPIGGEGVGERKSEGDDSEDLFNAYLNFGGFDISSGKQRSLDAEGEGNGVKINRSDSNESEVESCVNEIGSALQTLQQASQYPSTELTVDVKMGGALSEPTPLGIVLPRHGRSLSMDSFMSKMNLGSKTQPPSSQKGPSHVFSLEFGNGEFTPAEMEKIVTNEKLAEIALSDPKRVKRILANRLSAARSKERKMRYISELEHKVQNLQSETSTLSKQVTLLQRDSTGLTNQNNELKFRLQAMEQQAQLKDALNEALNAEVQRLKLAAAQLGEVHSSSGTSEQLTPEYIEHKVVAAAAAATAAEEIRNRASGRRKLISCGP